MSYTIGFAGPEDETGLQEIFQASEMDLAGEIREHIVIKQGDRLIGGGMLTQTDPDSYHLIVFAISAAERQQGLGSLLLQQLMGRPWDYCCAGSVPSRNSYCITTVAKGKSAGFYARNGFHACSFSDLYPPFHDQCQICPDQHDCTPVAMQCSRELSPSAQAGEVA